MSPEISKEQLSLGVGGEVNKAPSDLDIVRSRVSEFFAENYETDRNPAHSERVIKILEDLGYNSEGLEMATLLHDVVDHGIVTPKSDDLHEKAENLIGELHSQVEDKNTFIYAVGCSISASKWESEVAEAWRPSAFEKILSSGTESEGDVDSAILMGAISKNSSILDGFPSDIVEDVLKSNSLFDLDTGKLRDAMTKLDVEGVLIKAAEIMDNLEHPPRGNPASTWRDCTEIFNCYGPALDLFGFKDIASELRGKALEFYYGDPDGSAEHQREISEKYFDDVKGQIEEGIAGSRSEDDGLEISSIRIKSEGSLRQKLHEEGYRDFDLVPDGIGSRVIVPDEMTSDQMEALAKSFQKSVLRFSRQVDALHTRGDDPLEIRKKEKSGYSAIHLTFVYHTPDGQVPYEVQFVTKKQHRIHEIGKASHMLFKGGITNPYDHVLKDMQHIDARAHHLQSQALKPELNPNTWAQVLRYLPGLDTPLHEAFKFNGSAEGKTVLLPYQLSSINLENLADDIDVESDIDAVFLPPDKLEVGHFFKLIELIDPALGNDRRIIEAVELLQSIKFKTRKDGEPTLEGHLLPTAVNVAILATISGEHWEEGGDPTEFLSKTITAALLHDVIEDTSKAKHKVSEKEISDRFGSDVSDTVSALSTFDEIEDEHERRAAYAEKVAENPKALLIKLSDRMQNHQTDLVRLAEGVDQEIAEDIFDYFEKTDAYLTEKFDKLPDEYKRVRNMIWDIARYFGYRN